MTFIISIRELVGSLMIRASSGTVVNPRPVMIMEWTKNLENAKKFIDYTLSDEVQQFVADGYLLPGRSDFPAHPDRIGMDGITVFPMDWIWMRENQEE